MVRLRITRLQETFVDGTFDNGTNIIVREPSGYIHKFIVTDGRVTHTESHNNEEVVYAN